MSAWDRFFCGSCQTERALADKVVLKSHARCSFCVKKKGRPSVGQPPTMGYDEYEPPSHADYGGVMDAYREAYSE